MCEGVKKARIMKITYLTAIIPPEGGDGELKNYQCSCASDFGWHSPLPLMVPLYSWKESFPRDRVDPTGLKKLPVPEVVRPRPVRGTYHPQTGGKRELFSRGSLQRDPWQECTAKGGEQLSELEGSSIESRRSWKRIFINP